MKAVTAALTCALLLAGTACSDSTPDTPPPAPEQDAAETGGASAETGASEAEASPQFNLRMPGGVEDPAGSSRFNVRNPGEQSALRRPESTAREDAFSDLDTFDDLGLPRVDGNDPIAPLNADPIGPAPQDDEDDDLIRLDPN